jgi:hypothetical protein
MESGPRELDRQRQSDVSEAYDSDARAAVADLAGEGFKHEPLFSHGSFRR